MYKIIKNVIDRGSFNLSAVLDKIDTLWIDGRLDDAQREELVTLARYNAKSENSINFMPKLKELEERITKLEQAEGLYVEDEIAEYTSGRWYYSGNKVMYNGKEYECIAPEGQVCVWSPTEYPAYWKESVGEQ